MSLAGHTTPALSPLPEGTILKNYRLLQVLGQGGFGITYFASELETNRNIIIKECFPVGMCVRDAATEHIRPMYPELQDDYEASLESLKEEVDKLAKLDYRHIEHIEEVFESHGSIFYVTPWLIGGSLLSKLQDAEANLCPLSPDMVQIWLKQILSAFDYLHSMGIYHGNIKPSHVLFNELDQAILIGFDATAHISDVMDSGSVDSAPSSYAAPEQVTGKGTVGPWTDFYSFAAIAYRLITAKPIPSVKNRVAGEQAAALADSPHAQHYPKYLLDAIEQNLDLDGKKRFQHVQDWVDARTQPAKKPKKLRSIRNRDIQRRRVTIAVGLLIIAGLVWFSNRGDSPSQELKGTPTPIAKIEAAETSPEPMTTTEPASEPEPDEMPEPIQINNPKLDVIDAAFAQLQRNWELYTRNYQRELSLNETNHLTELSQPKAKIRIIHQTYQTNIITLRDDALSEWTIYLKKAEEYRDQWAKEIGVMRVMSPVGSATHKSPYLQAINQKDEDWLKANKDLFIPYSPAPACINELFSATKQRMDSYFSNCQQMRKNNNKNNPMGGKTGRPRN